MQFDLSSVPFSRYGSYMAFSQLAQTGDQPGGVYLRSVHGDALRREVCRLEVLHGSAPVPYTVQAEPACLRLKAEAGAVEICLPEANVLRLRGRRVGLRLSFLPGNYSFAMPAAGKRWQINSFAHRLSCMLSPLAGQVEVDAPWIGDHAEKVQISLLPDPDSGVMDCALQEIHSTWVERDYPQPFDACLELVQSEFQDWLEKSPSVPPEYAQTNELAAYVNWCSVVAPLGHLKRPAMFMSKNWMTNVWSWDHCFNAMALVYKQPALAWDQFMVMFDCQDEHGALPDSVNDKAVVWNFCKPPIHGWALKRMLERTVFITPERLQEIYRPLSRWTAWWLNSRDYDRDGIPQYHHGNDSGWDNCTAFQTGLPLESPDLSAFLVLQMETLAEIAGRLGKPRAAQRWQKRADALLKNMLAHFWRGDRFVAVRSGDHAVRETETLFLYLPLLLGMRLPEDVRRALVAGLTREGRFITAHGLATESPSSPDYVPDGYWRGPIWAPSTMIIVEGLAACGELELARQISRKFCQMAARSGMAENYDALTGEGLRDKAYTWTSSVFQVLAHDWLL